MALQEGRSHDIVWDISNILNDVAEAGVVVCYKAANPGSGEALGNTAGQVTLLTNPSGAVPAGVLMAPFANVDQTLQILNWHKDEHDLGDPAPLCLRGYIVTNKIIGTPSVGNVAYLSSSGNFNPVKEANGGTVATPPVGRFLSPKDENGYAKIHVNLPWMS